jgi:hypothetical protein
MSDKPNAIQTIREAFGANQEGHFLTALREASGSQ